MEHYRIINDSKLGSGVSSVVKMAIYIPTNREIAVKIINVKQIDKQYNNKKYHEIEILENINHPNILKAFQTIRTDEEIYIFTEKLEENFFDYLTEKIYVGEGEAKDLFVQIASSVFYLHNLMICHRDLKLENLMFDQDRRLKLLDFGFAAPFNFERYTHTWCGTVDYAAPELWKRHRYHGPEPDIWALGVILYVMLTGYVPFMDTNATLNIHYSYPSKIQVSEECKMLLNKIFQVRTERCNILQIMEDPWFENRDLIVGENNKFKLRSKIYKPEEVKNQIENHFENKKI